MEAMARFAPAFSVAAIVFLGSGAYATILHHNPKEAPVDSTLGVPLKSRIPCDGATNPEDQVGLTTTFSPGGWEREFRIEVYEDKYCKRGDLGWACVQPGHVQWKQEWSADSTVSTAASTYGLSSCETWGSKDKPQIILTGWYKETTGDKKIDEKEVWKQVEVKKVASRWETYEFTDPKGGTAQVQIDRR